MSKIQLYNDDCLNIMRSLEKDSIDLIITSPPYYNAREYSHWENYDDYISDMTEIFAASTNLLKNQKYCVINVADVISGEKKQNRKPITSSFIQFMIKLGYEYEDDFIWDKGEVQSKRGVCAEPYPYYYKPINCYEHILVFRKNFLNKEKLKCPLCNSTITQSNGIASDGVQSWECKNQKCIRSAANRGKRFSERTILMESAKSEINKISSEVLNTFRRDIACITPEIKINSKGENKIGHSAPYPVMIPKFAIECYSKKNDIVLDCFMGSGTTGIACADTNRNFIGIEINKQYFDVAEERINNYDIQQKMI